MEEGKLLSLFTELITTLALYIFVRYFIVGFHVPPIGDFGYYY